MSATTLESLANSIRSDIASQQEQWSDFFRKTFDESMGIVDLNMKAAKDSLDRFADTSERIFNAKSPQEIFSVDSDELRKGWDRMLAYGNELSSVASNLQNEMNLAAQNQFNNCCGLATKAYVGTVNATPTMSNDPFEFMKSTMENMKEQFDQWTNAATQTARTSGRNLVIESVDTSSSKKKEAKSA